MRRMVQHSLLIVGGAQADSCVAGQVQPEECTRDDEPSVPCSGMSVAHWGGYAWCVSSRDGGDTPTLTSSPPFVSC